MLRIGEFGFFRIHREEAGIKPLDILQNGSGFDEIRRGARLRIEAVFQFRVLKPSNRGDAATQVAPKLLDGGCAGIPSGHANNGDTAERGVRHGQSLPRKGSRSAFCRANTLCWQPVEPGFMKVLVNTKKSRMNG